MTSEHDDSMLKKVSFMEHYKGYQMLKDKFSLFSGIH